jgi:hypothetical protein
MTDEPTYEPRIPGPFTMAGLRELPEQEDRWLIERWLPEDANAILAGAPKTYKTLLLEEMAMALGTATPFLGRFRVPEPRRVGMVLMEDSKYRTRRRLERLALARGLTLRDVDGLFFWFRPPLRLASPSDLEDLAFHIEDRGLDALWIDNWSHVATGDSNDADAVTQQLAGYSGLRTRFPGLTVGLSHHVRKPGPAGSGDRLSDLIRNSTAFGAWYDVGVVLSRKDEQSPVKVRAEMRDAPAPDSFIFTVEDQYPAGTGGGAFPSGWLRLLASDTSPALMEREAAARRFVAPVREYLARNNGCSKEQLKRNITGDNALILAAFDLLCADNVATYREPEKRGTAGRCELLDATPLNPAATPLSAGRVGNPADPAVTPVGGTGSAGVPRGANGEEKPSGVPTPNGHACACGCGRDVGGPGIVHIACKLKGAVA